MYILVFAYYVVILCNYLFLCGYVASWCGVSSPVVRDGLGSRLVSVWVWCLWVGGMVAVGESGLVSVFSCGVHFIIRLQIGLCVYRCHSFFVFSH
jgi:hypothetical protein